MILDKMRQLLAALLLVLIPAIAVAQAPTAPAPSPAPSDQLLKPEQIEALVSPIALYPDSLLSNILMASTYPLEVCRPTAGLPRTRISPATC